MKVIYIHPKNPQERLVKQVVKALQDDKLIIYPTDISYAFGLSIHSKNALEQLKRIRQLDDKHQFTLLCKDLSEIATYANVDNAQFRELKNNTPAAITFIFEASKETPKKLAHPKKRTIGIRISDTPFLKLLLEELGEPILTSSLKLADGTQLTTPYEIEDHLQNQIELFVNSGEMTSYESSIVDMTTNPRTLIRQGFTDVSHFATVQ